MTNEELFTDLKQFVEATVSQSEASVNARLDRVDARFDQVATKADIHNLDAKLDAIQDGIADALTQSAEATDTALQDHDRRLTRLEQRAI